MDEQTPPTDQSNQDSLVPRSPGTTTTALSLSEPSELPQWAEMLAQIAQDKRHDLAPGILRLWKVKLSHYRDQEIVDALLLYAGEYFPSVDTIIATMDRRRERRAEEKGDLSTNESRRNRALITQYMQEHGGKT